MAQKTSINIKPCNIGSSEPHNRRTAEYLTRINKEKFYIRTDLMPKNEAWVAPDFRNTSLTERYNQIAVMVKEKTGRAMQTKDRERVNKKTGKVTIVRGSTPLKEGVVVIKEDTTMEQLKHFCEVCKERWGITPLQVFIHRDEGHYSNPEDIATWKPNLHAHIVWDWMDHETGKSCKLDEKAMCEMQTVLAECLEMQRGISKKLTGKEHLERNDFIITKQKQEAEKVKAEKDAALAAKEKAEAERQSIEGKNKAKKQYSLSLDNEIADKERQLKYFNTPIVYRRHMHYWILWPKDLDLSDQEQLLVLRHELAHIHHHDITIKNIIYLLSIFYWWNPLGSFIRKKADLLLELRVDKTVAFSSQETTTYLECLLKIFQKSKTNFSIPSGIGFCSSGKSMIVQRFNYLTNDTDSRMSIRGLVMKLLPIILSVIIYAGSFIFILEASYIPESVKESTLQLTSENSYAVINASGTYDIYIYQQYVETVTSMKYYTDIQKIYSSYKEFYNEN